MEKVRIKFIKEPKDARFIKNTHTILPIDQAYKFVSEGIAVGYDAGLREEFNPFLSDEYPHRDLLAENGIYTEEQLAKRLHNIEKIDGIGSKTAEKYADLLAPEVEEEDEFLSDLEDAINEEE